MYEMPSSCQNGRAVVLVGCPQGEQTGGAQQAHPRVCPVSVRDRHDKRLHVG
jgi:hypothetical protein